MNLKQIASTLALLGSGALVFTGCDKQKATTEVPGGGAAEGEAKCAADDHPADGHCGGDEVGADEAAGDADEAGGEAAAEGGEEAAEGE